MSNMKIYEGICPLDACMDHKRVHRFWAHYNVNGERWCGRGKHWVDPEQFHKATQWCKACKSTYFQQTYDPQKARKKNYRYYYKHDDVIYDRLFKLQNGVCAICGQPPTPKKQGRRREEHSHLSTDHDHKTGQVRGLLCDNCNRAVGWVRDNPNRVDQIRDYIAQDGTFPFL